MWEDVPDVDDLANADIPPSAAVVQVVENADLEVQNNIQ